MQLLVTKAQLARKLRITPQTLNTHLQNSLRGCLVGDLCDFNHQSVIKYCRKRCIKDRSYPRHPNDTTVPEELDEEPQNEPFRPENITENDIEAALGDAKSYMDLTLRQLVERHGTVTQLKDWLSAVKLLLDIEAKDLANNTTSGDYISREFVKTHVLGLIETMNVRLLNDSPKSIVSEVLVRIKAGANREQLEVLVRGILSQDIQSVKEKARRNLAR